eukprot:02737.XXX_47606_45528_1 [CDS] Oithona nana genome sequencing.
MASIKTKNIKVKHPKRKLYRASEPLLSVFMWGINHTVRELSHISIPVMLMPDDFRAFTKIKVDSFAFNKENLPSHFKVKEYCPLVFRNLRERFGIDDASYLKSLTKAPLPMEPPLGKSQAKFYTSQDHIYMIRTMSSEEVEQTHCILNAYHPYVVERRGKTLLPQMLGMYRLTVDNVEHYIAVFRQVFSDNLKIHTKYKLKGSTVDREASQKERAKDSPLYKDNDFLQDGVKVTIGPEAKKMVMETLDADVAFLAKNQLMDYSLILGVHNRATAEEEKLLNQNQEDSNLDNEEDEEGEDLDEDSGLPSALTPPDSPPFQDMDPLDPSGEHLDQEKDIYALPSKDQNEVYFLALVDILTTYGVKKQAAKYAKTVTYGANKVEGISTIEPDQYAARFLEFIANAME